MKVIPLAISLNEAPARLAAVGGIVVFLIVLWVCRARFGALIIGADGRTSTSKFQALLWTLLLAWAILALTLQGKTDFDIAPDYLALLGFPALALVFAKGIVQQKIDQGEIAKPPPAQTDPDAGAAEVAGAYLQAQTANEEVKKAVRSGSQAQAVAAAQAATDAAATAVQAATAAVSVKKEKRGRLSFIGDLVNNDAGKADIADFQYLTFNLVAAAYFLINFIDDNALPQIPDTLIALTGVSAATYVTNKAVMKQKPTLTGVSPASAAPGTVITLRGMNLAGVGSNPDGTAAVTEVKFGTASAAAILADDAGVSTAVPASVEGYVPGTPKTVQVTVLNAAGLESNPVAFTIV